MVEYRGWDYVKYLMARMHCGMDNTCIETDMEDRKLVVAFLRDWYGKYSTIVLTLSGSPPKAYTIISADEFDPKKDDAIVVLHLLVCSITLKPCRRYDGFSIDFKKHGLSNLSIRELLSRKDTVVVNECLTHSFMGQQQGNTEKQEPSNP